jgi:hypothetical protein
LKSSEILVEKVLVGIETTFDMLHWFLQDFSNIGEATA